MAVLLVGVTATGQPVSSDTAEQVQDDESSWLSRTLHRYFGNSQKDNNDVQGEAWEIVDQYMEYAGMPIEVVIVYQVLNFEDGWDNEKGYSTRTLTNLTSPLYTYTRESVVRNYLTFRQGDKLDPFALADSERMLRDLDFISDAQITLIPLQGEIESVAVVVEVKDRWPFGVEGNVVSAEKFSFSAYSTNVAGLGIKFYNEVIHFAGGKPSWGYQGYLRKENIKKSFLDAEIGFEDSYRLLQRKLLLERRLVYPGLNYLGGILFDQEKKRDLARSQENSTSKFEYSEVWAGKNLRLYNPREPTTTARSVLVPAIMGYRKIFLDRPSVTPDTSRQYHHRKAILGGLTYRRMKNYKTKFLFKDGEFEDLFSGFVIKGVAGYEIREFEERTVLSMESMAISIRNRGDIVFGQFNIGGYLREKKMEEGLLLVGGGYFSPLFGEDRYHHRLYFRTLYSRGLGRYPYDHFYLDDSSGIRGLSRGLVAGNQRLVGNFEYRMFTPLSIMGFRLSLQLFSDIGVIAGEDDAIFKKKIYTSTGIGFRVRNPELVFPTVELRLSLLSNIGESGVAFSVKVGNVGDVDLKIPDVKPATLSYE